MTHLSVALITKNEEQNIERCLKAVLAIADDIVVVDSGSTDKTAEICHRFSQVRFEQRVWKGFGPTRQMAVELCKHDLILSLDADEVVSDPLLQSLKELKTKPENANQAFLLSRRTNYCGQWIRFCGWYPDYQLRLFNRKTARWSPLQVHETVLTDPPVKVGKLKGDLLHYSYNSLSDHMKRIDHYSTLGAKDIVASGKRHFLFLRAILHAKFRFFKTYILKLGILDGRAGLTISTMAAMVVFLKYNKARHLLSKNRAMD